MQRILLLLLLAAAVVAAVFLIDPEEAAEDTQETAPGPAVVHPPEPKDAATLEAATATEPAAEILRESTDPGAADADSLAAPSLPMRVVDPFGTPQPGIPVALALRTENDIEEVFRASSDADGLLTMRCSLTELAEGEELVLGFPFPVLDGTPEWVTDPSQWGDEIVEMVLPVHGSAEVHLLDVDGNPWHRPLRVKIGPTPGEGHEGPADVYANLMSSLGVEAENGVAFFPIVGMFKRIQVGMGADPWATWRGAEAAGPSVAGEVVRLELHQYRKNPVFRVALQDEQGEPIPNRAVVLRWKTFTASSKNSLSTGYWEHEGFRSDQEGILEFPVSRGVYGDRIEVRVTTADADLRNTRSGIVLMPNPMPLPWENVGDPLLVELEDLELRAAERIGSGSILTADSQPVEASIETQQIVSLQINGFDKATSQDIPGFRILQEDNGNFHLFGVCVTDDIFLKVTPKTGIAQKRNFKPGAKDLDFVIAPDFFINGQLNIPEGVDPNGFRLRFFPEGEVPFAHFPSQTPDAIPEADGSFQLRGLPDTNPGTVAVIHEESTSLLLDIPEVKPTQDPEMRDLRLYSIDLGNFTRWTLHLILPPRTQQHSAKVLILDPPMPKYRDMFYLPHGDDLDVATLQPTMRLQVEMTGMRSEEITVTSGHHEIKMREAMKLSLQFQDVPQLRKGYTLRGSTRLVDAKPWDSDTHFFPNNWREGLRIPIKQPGKLRFQVFLVKPDGRRSIGMKEWAWDFEVSEDGAAKPLSITIEQAELLNAYQQLDQPPPQHPHH
ncbi:MAG: hypothetical protein ACPG31_02325 [Planctomycetota bacterium]